LLNSTVVGYYASMPKADTALAVEGLSQLIYEVRGQKVMLDSDLALVYGVPTGALNRAVKRNAKRFPDDFVFRLTMRELEALRCQFGISKTARPCSPPSDRGGRRYLPYAFTEHGAIMAANVLNSARAVQMSVFVVRAFVKMRAALSDNRQLARKLAALEKELKERLDVHEGAIVGILQRVMDIINPPALPEPPPKKRIGFQVKEGRRHYDETLSSAR
jgi:phage regulator Rha-like protein